jgi:hypothetical protein
VFNYNDDARTSNSLELGEKSPKFSATKLISPSGSQVEPKPRPLPLTVAGRSLNFVSQTSIILVRIKGGYG